MYEAHFGLAQLPFRLAPDPRFYVDAAPHRAAIAALAEALRRGEAFVPLVGEFGTGKTTVARRLLEDVQDAQRRVGELPGMRIDGDDLFERVAEALGLAEEASPSPSEDLAHQLEALARDGRAAVLLVDDAHRLEADALARLRTLTAVRVDGRAALQVLLVGRALPAGVDDLQDAGQPLEAASPLRIEPLDAAGTHEYVHARLAFAGWTGRPAFERNTTAEIHARCNGNPGRINRLCGHVLLQLYMEGRDDLSPDIVAAVDDLLRQELDGKPATARLPPPAQPSRPGPPTVYPAHGSAAAGVDSLFDVTSVLPAPARLPVPVNIAPGRAVLPLAPAPVPRRRRAPSRGMVKQGALAAALLVGGGLLWQSVSTLAARHAAQARLAAAAVAVPLPAQALPANPPAPQPASAARAPTPSADEVLALAERVIAQSPPRAAPPPSAAPAPAAAAPRRVVADAGGRPRAQPVHKGAARSAVATAATPSPVATACSIESEALGLCARSRALLPVAAASPAPAAAVVRETSFAAPRPAAAPACDATHTALALCPGGAGASP
jgi:type II secretory pathway predicted ATPase ExeA